VKTKNIRKRPKTNGASNWRSIHFP
jgi:hypothetical protein